MVCVWKGMDPPPGVQGGDVCECPYNTFAAVCPFTQRSGICEPTQYAHTHTHTQTRALHSKQGPRYGPLWWISHHLKWLSLHEWMTVQLTPRVSSHDPIISVTQRSISHCTPIKLLNSRRAVKVRQWRLAQTHLYSMHSSCLSEPGAYITHNATEQVSIWSKIKV